MAKHVVTGGAGFVGSHLVDALLDDGHEVVVVDGFTANYSRQSKLANLDTALRSPACHLVEGGLGELDLEGIFSGAQVIHHYAAQTGIAEEWLPSLPSYFAANVELTMKVIAAASAAAVPRVIYASSGSTYGVAGGPTGGATTPLREDNRQQPASPYGISKLAGEHLALAAASARGVQLIALRYFYLYGPRQRPDVGLHALIEAAIEGRAIPFFGLDHFRDLTYVCDAVQASIKASSSSYVGPLNVATGRATPLTDVVAWLEQHAVRGFQVIASEAPPGFLTGAVGDPTRAAQVIGWSGHTRLEDGLAAQLQWQKDVGNRAAR